jgi:phage-related minor tail protein
MANKVLDRFSSPVSKLLPFFVGSRDDWKAKHHAVKAESKLRSNQVRAAEKSRKKWRERAEAAELRVKELEREIEQLKFHDRHP